MDVTNAKSREDVISIINEFVNRWDDELPDYSFAHVVLGDFNLSNNAIDYCMKEAQHWFAGKTAFCIEELEEKPFSAFLWERYKFTQLVKMTDEIIEFLQQLKRIPESIRVNERE